MTTVQAGAPSVEQLCEIVTAALCGASGKSELSAPIDKNAAMGSVPEWDSLSFVAVFLGVGEALDVELDEDDAIHFTSIQAMYGFLLEIMDC